jgi:peptidyl-prolyl cis-trans isomerase SurA
MKKIIITVILYFSFIQFSVAENHEVKILYKVNENIISNIDVANEIRYLRILDKNFQNIELNKLKDVALKSLIKEFIKKDEIEKYYNVDYNSTNIDKYINRIGLNLGFNNIDDLIDHLSKNNIKLKDIRRKLNIEKTWNSLIYEIYFKKIVINKEQISNKLEKIINQKTYQKSFRLSEIVFSAKDKISFEKKYNEILHDIEKTNFNQAAIIHSISDTANSGGEVGWVNTSQLSKKIYDEIKNLKAEQMSRPITTPGGMLILKVNEIKDVLNEKLDKDLELSNMIKIEQNRQLTEYSIIHYKKIERNSYVKKI